MKTNSNKIAITADLHLKEDGHYSERYDALTYILDYLLENEIGQIIIAGDLFDKGYVNYKNFEDVCLKEKYQRIKFFIIPGNHDYNLKQGFFTADNIKILEKTDVLTFGGENEFSFLFTPYKNEKTMGEEVGLRFDDLSDKNWALVGHGDYIAGQKTPNPYERGTYMPLTRGDISRFNPSFVFLGHIHKPTGGDIFYPGSPYPVDRNEIGVRRFLVFDVKKKNVESVDIDTNIIYQNARLLMFPFDSNDDEERYVKKFSKNTLSSFNLDKDKQKKVSLTVSVDGYTANEKKKIEQLIIENIKNEVKEVKIDMTKVSMVEGGAFEKIEIVERVSGKISHLFSKAKSDEDSRVSVTKHALQAIYKK